MLYLTTPNNPAEYKHFITADSPLVYSAQAYAASEYHSITLYNDSAFISYLYPSKTTKYYVWTQSVFGCFTSLDSFTIVVNDLDSLITNPIVICEGNSTQLYANDAIAISYSWLPTTGLDNATIQNPIASPSTTTTYTVTANVGACAIKRNVTLTVNSNPSLDLQITDTSLCEGSQTTLSYSVLSDTNINMGDLLLNSGVFQPTLAFPLTKLVAGVSNESHLTKVSFNYYGSSFSNVTDLADMDIWLESPNGTKVMLMSDVNNFNYLYSTIHIYDNAPPAPTSPVTGIIDMQGTNNAPNTNELNLPTTLASFNNGPQNGTWKLYGAHDNLAGDVILITNFTLTFGPTNNPISWQYHPTLDTTNNTNPTIHPITTPVTYYASITNSAGCITTDSVTYNTLKPMPHILSATLDKTKACNGDSVTVILVSTASTDTILQLINSSYVIVASRDANVVNNTFTFKLPVSTNDSSFVFTPKSSLGCIDTQTVLPITVNLPFVSPTIISTGSCPTVLNTLVINKPDTLKNWPNNNESTIIPQDSGYVIGGYIFVNDTMSGIVVNFASATTYPVTVYYGEIQFPSFAFSILDSVTLSSVTAGENYFAFNSSIPTAFHPVVVASRYGPIHLVCTGLGYDPGVSEYALNSATFYNSTMGNKMPQTAIVRVPDTLNANLFDYTWTPSVGLSNANIQNPNARPSVATTYTVTVSNGCAATATISINSNTGTLAQATANNATSISGLGIDTVLQNDGTTVNYTDDNCNLIATVDDGAGGNILGNTTANVIVDTTVTTYNTQPYTRRHFKIEPTNQGAATVTLYQTQNDFDDFNTYASANGWPLLPANPSDASDMANLRITQVHGNGVLGNGTFALITPTVAWDSVNNYWTLTFPVDSFSSFYVHTGNVVLAITLSQFDVTKTTNSDIINWTTATEINNHYFTVERSNDGNNFEPLAKINSKVTNGNSTKSLNYSFEDTKPLSGYNYYRLLQTDLNGKTTIATNIKYVWWNTNATVVTLYPNPATTTINLDIVSIRNANTTIYITDITGKIVKTIETKTTKGSNNISVDITDLSPSLYNVQILENKKEIQTLKLNKL